MSSKTRHTRTHLKHTAKRQGGKLSIDQFTEWFNIKSRRRARRAGKYKKMEFFGAGTGFWGHGHAGRR